ncbi:hypothetical protein Pmani_032170 [Petrolisthes manimaculis]|uniref:Flavin-containing monooxygenase n=1 Tax=Petrolisthes manimaculis TaxID=1843537 RepID=A0AAE1NTK6_9EUCA|nr:hypothetical protein Pmani_032170 [Petrolisthes manimaculis]
MMRVVGVIGAGAAGLCAARHALASTGLSPVVWEKSSQVGGTWVYTPHTGKDQDGLPIHSSMYQSLKTNLPKEVMGFPDFPFSSDKEESFIHHSDVLKYLKSYTDNFNLNQYIKFRHHVELVTPVVTDEKTTWQVTVQDLDTKTSSTTVCDALLICNGHYSVPRMPQVEDIERYKGKQVHSHDYREPSPYKGLTVVVLGAAASGLDISLELATVAKEVLLSHNFPLPIPSELPPNMRQVQGVVSALDEGFVFADGSSAQADVIMYCTGYEFTFPFLTDDCGVTIENNIVKPLYKHVINTTHPSMGFIGIPFQVCPFPTFDFQVRYFLGTLTGIVTLESQNEMVAATQFELECRRSLGYSDKKFHQLGFVRQEQYLADLAKNMHAAQIPQHILTNFKVVVFRAIFSIMKFKQYSYSNDGNTLIETLHGKRINTKFDLGSVILRRVAYLFWHDFARVCTATFSFLQFSLKKIFTK